MTAEIESINSLGLVTIRFSTHMKDAPINSTNATNSTNVTLTNSINVTLAQYSAPFSWSIVHFKADLLQIQLNFSDLISVSPEEIQDTISVNLTEAVRNQLLISSELLVDLNESSWVI